MVISLRIPERENGLIKDFAKFYGTSVSDFIRTTVMERIEDEIDLRAYEEAMAEYKKNPVTYTLDEVEKELRQQ